MKLPLRKSVPAIPASHMTRNITEQLPGPPPTDPMLDDDPVERDDAASFAIVGVGASAGGLEAFTQLLKALPADTGMAFVLVQHLAPTHPSALAEILSRATKMPVMEVQDEPTVEPNHVYVIPPDRSMIIGDGALQLLPREGGAMHRPIDQFFRSLASERRHRAIGVVLSGTATDGTLGLEAIKAEGGITFAQDATAQQEGMPRSAIASGCVDFVLPPSAIAQEIVRIGKHPYAAPEAAAKETDRRPNIAMVVQLLQRETSADFSNYKFNTLYRRITRRMVFQNMNGLAEYVEFLRQSPAEVEALYQDILISVTSFFRDPESFEALKSRMFPRLLENRTRHDPVRIWSLGCSTGPEAYSLAMTFVEAAEAAGSSVPMQLFATDLNAAGIEKARAGIYSKDIEADVSPERLQRFFTEVDGGYRISKTIRDLCVFSRHNVLSDPPFSRMDLISCRNLLIYLEPVLQQRIMPILHYALKPGGCLWLGISETIGTHRNLFDADDAKHRIFVRKPGSNPGNNHFSLQHSGAPRIPFAPVGARPNESADLHREADRLLSAKFAPPGVLISADLEILQYRGDTGPFLTPAPGKASLNLLKMLREGLLVAVRAAVVRASKEEAPVRAEGLQVKSNGGYRELAIEVIPIKGGRDRDGGFLVLFDGAKRNSIDHIDSDVAAAPQENSGVDPDNGRLAQELAATREFLQSVIEQQESANEELQSANEEVQSANEELQSTNEELETSKEEIQSSNEELATVNDELNNRNGELNRINDDLANLFGSVQMAVIIVGPDLRIRRFTPTAEKLLNLISTDVGRPLADIKLNLDGVSDLESLLKEVRDTANVMERDVQDEHGCWYSLRLRPYKTLDNRIDGVVVMLVDVDAMTRAHEDVRVHEARYRTLFESLDDGFCVIEKVAGAAGEPLDFCYVEANTAFAVQSGLTDVIGKTMRQVVPQGNDDWYRLYDTVLTTGESIRIEGEFVGPSRMLEVHAFRVEDTPRRRVGVIFRDISERTRMQDIERKSEQRVRVVLDSMPQKINTSRPNGEVDYFSPQWAEFSGLTFAEIESRGWAQLLHPDDLAETLRCWQHSVATGEPFGLEHRFRTADGAYRWQLTRAMPVRDADGTITMWISSSTDIEEQRQSANRVQQLANDLAESDRLKNEFLAMLAHELRNPLAPIRNAVQVLQIKKDDAEAVQLASAMIERQIGQMVRLVDDLLDVSRISQGKIELRTGRIELASAVQHAADDVGSLYQSMNRELVVNLPTQPIYVNADPTRLAQVLGNLLNNACKYSDRGGRVDLIVERDREQVVMTVLDNGIGIAADQLTRVFNMFTQVDASLERSVGGLGIGLTLVKTLVELHGGTVEGRSAGLGHGSQFLVRLPISADSPLPPPSRSVNASPPPPTARRILVVEDNMDSATSLSLLLQLSGNETYLAHDGLEAIQAAETFRPEVILLDIGLPKLSGYEVCRRIRAQSWGQAIAIVALTGWGQAEDRKQSKAAGFDGHVVKPVDHAALTRLLAELLPATL